TVMYVFGNSLFVQKMVTIFPIVFLMLFSAVKVVKLFGIRTHLIFITFLIAFPAMFEYAIQVRMYTWAMLFVTVCGVLAYDIFLMPSKRKWSAFVVTALAAAYTHYFALVSVAIIFGILLLLLMRYKKENVKSWFGISVLAVLGYLPWLTVMLWQVNKVTKGYIIPEITLKTIISYFDWAFHTETPYSTIQFEIIIIIAFLLSVFRGIRFKNQADMFAVVSMLVPVLTMAAGVIVSVLATPIFKSRYLFPSMGLLILGVAVSLRTLSNRVLPVLLCFFFFSTVVQYQGTYKVEYLTTKVVETEAFFRDHIEKDDLIVYNFTGFGFIYQYYLPDQELVYLGDMDFNREFQTIWYFDTFNYLYFDDAILNTYQLNKEFIGDYGIEHNEFKVYKITRK
ncbi:MAG: hypothetical protein PHT89_11960, partial [Lachnospiraceae bacterium]|nr:hypothetical protein [Lachnospiraceae bacterium]